MCEGGASNQSAKLSVKTGKRDVILFVVEYERLQKFSRSRHPAHQKKVKH